MGMWTHYYDLPDRFIEDDRVWRECMSGGQVKIDPQTGERSVDYDPLELRREGDCLISIKEKRLHLCFSMEKVITVPDGVRSIASGAFTDASTPNLQHLILPASVDGVAMSAIDCSGFDELTYNNDRIHVCDGAFNVRSLKLMHYPPENQTWDLREMWHRHDAAMQRQTPDPMPQVSDDDLDNEEDLDLPF